MDLVDGQRSGGGLHHRTEHLEDSMAPPPLAQRAPGCQVRAVDPFPSQQLSQLTTLGARVGLGQDTGLLLRRELASLTPVVLGYGNHFGLRLCSPVSALSELHPPRGLLQIILKCPGLASYWHGGPAVSAKHQHQERVLSGRAIKRAWNPKETRAAWETTRTALSTAPDSSKRSDLPSGPTQGRPRHTERAPRGAAPRMRPSRSPEPRVVRARRWPPLGRVGDRGALRGHPPRRW